MSLLQTTKFRRRWLLGVFCAGLLCNVSAFYVPGVAPHDFLKGEAVEIKVEQLLCVSHRH